MIENYFRITSKEDGNEVSLVYFLSTGSEHPVNMEYRTSYQLVWQGYVIGSNIQINVDEWVEFRNDSGTLSHDGNNRYYFAMSKKVVLSGNLWTLLDYTNDSPTTPQYCFNRLFMNQTTIIDAYDLVTQCGSMSAHSQESMFYGCTSLVRAPSNDFSSAYTQCYMDMFHGCTSLVKAPRITHIGAYSQWGDGMFYNCTSLEEVYVRRFFSSSSCIRNMFYGCSSLKKITTAGPNFSSQSANAFRGVPDGGTMVLLPELFTTKNLLTQFGFGSGTYAPGANWKVVIEGQESSGTQIEINGKKVKKLHIY